jgi:hypothetical protein
MFNWLPGTEMTAPTRALPSVDGVEEKAYYVSHIRPWQ